MAGESIAVAIYKLGLENQQYIAATRQAAQAGDQLVASQEKLVVSEEKVGAASRLSANAVRRKVEANDEAIRAERKHAEAIAFVAKAEQQGAGTAAERALLLEQEAQKLQRTTDKLAAKAKAERDAAQAAKEAEAAAKNLARLESEHATALQNVATALGVDRAALIASANAGNRHAASTLDMMNKIVGLNKELQAGNLNLATHAKQVDELQQRYRGSVTAIATQEAAMRKSNTVTGLARHELINLSRQLQDIGVSLAGGQSPFRILIEQGSQIADIFASSRAAFGEVFRNMISWVGRAAGSMTGLITIATALGGAGAALALNWLEGQRAVEKALIGIGERAGLTVQQVQKMAEATSATTRLSVSQARGAAIEFAQTGKIYNENIQVAVGLTEKFALTMGLSASEGAKQFAAILSDVNKGAETLDQKFGFLDGATKEYLSTLVAQNRQQEAQLLLMQKIEPYLTRGAAATSIWAKAWMSFTGALSNSIEVMGKALAQGVEFDRQQTARESGRARQGSPGRVAAQEMRGQLPVTAEAAAAATKKVEEYERALLDAANAAADSRFRQFSLEADAAVKSIFPQIEQIKNLTAALEDLERAQSDARISGRMGLAEQLQPAIDAVKLKKQLEEDSLDVQQRQVKAVREVADAYKDTAGEGKKVTVETALQLKNLDGQIKIYQQRTQRGVEAAVQEHKMTQLMLQGKSAAEAALIISKEQLLVHLQNMTVLKEQLSVAEARTGAAKIAAQYEVDINTRLREGATLSQAIAEASIKRQIAIENVNTAITEQIHALQQENELIQARIDGDYASVKAAQAYTNAIRQGADHLHAAALEAAVLENELVKASAAANKLQRDFLGISDLAGKLANIGAGSARNISTGFTRFEDIHTGRVGGGGPLVGAAGASTLFNVNIEAINKLAEAIEAQRRLQTPEGQKEAMEKAARAAEDAARAQEAAARAAEDAAEAMERAAAELAEAQKEWFSEVVANYLIRGFDPRVINAAIEAGQLNVGDASTRFQTQLDLYKRAGLTNEQILADIRAGIIGEGVKPTELLAAIDSLTGAVESNTEAQLGLSEFYTQQGNRLLGYRGFNVQRGGLGTAPGAIGGTGTGGIGAMPPGGILPPPGSIPLPPPYIPPPTGVGGIGGPIGGPQSLIRILNGKYVEGYYDANGQWITTKIIGTAPGIAMPANTVGVPVGSITTAPYSSFVPSTNLSGLYGQPTTRFAEGGLVDRPIIAMAGERGPEAFVPLKGGAIPVKLTGNNDNKPSTIVNINAPLVHFAAEPTRDEVRESAFQASQAIRRLMAG